MWWAMPWQALMLAPGKQFLLLLGSQFSPDVGAIAHAGLVFTL